jgi:para-nitrobenzyl esterase
MIGYWSQFVSTGVPSTGGAPAWPEVDRDGGDGPVMSLQPDGSRVITTFEADHQCTFWAGRTALRWQR